MSRPTRFAANVARRCIAWTALSHEPLPPETTARQRSAIACRLYAASLLLFALTCGLLHLLFAVIFRL